MVSAHLATAGGAACHLSDCLRRTAPACASSVRNRRVYTTVKTYGRPASWPAFVTSQVGAEAISTPLRCPHVRAISLAGSSAAEVENILRNAGVIAAADAISSGFSE